MAVLETLPKPPAPSKETPFSIYRKNYNAAKANIYKTFWDLDYLIMKSSVNAADFYFLQSVPIRELYYFIIKSNLESGD